MTAVGVPNRGIMDLKWQGWSKGRKTGTQKKYPGLPKKSLAQKLTPPKFSYQISETEEYTTAKEIPVRVKLGNDEW